MNRELLRHISRDLSIVSDRWEFLFRAERVDSPLANADAMVTFIPDSAAEILRSLRGPFSRRLAARPDRTGEGIADCAHNPYRAYYRAGEQAMTEAVVMAQATCHAAAPDEDPGLEMIGAVRAHAAPAIEAFCTVCRKYRLVGGCRRAAVTPR